MANNSSKNKEVTTALITIMHWKFKLVLEASIIIVIRADNTSKTCKIKHSTGVVTAFQAAWISARNLF